MMDKINTQYNKAVKLIKSAILQKQLEAAKAVNRQMLALYYGVGKYVSDNTRKGVWGTGAIETISEQLRRELPGLRGFGVSNIKNMRQFYESWNVAVNRQPTADDLQLTEKEIISPTLTLLNINRQPTAGNLDWHEFFSLSFTHHMEILSKTKTLEERVFYIHQAATLHWDKYTLRDNLKADLFHHQSQMPSNFAKTMPSTRHALKAISMFKDDYLLDFINVEELDERDPQDIDERIIGIVLYRDADKTYVEYLLQDYTQPMGVATYRIMPEKLKRILPPEEEFKRLLDGKEFDKSEK